MACYYKSDHVPEVLTISEIPSLSSCETEFLPLIFRDLCLLVIICYHPFWNNLSQHNMAIDCIVNILDYVSVHESFSSHLKILVAGDFNDLSKLYDTISSETGLMSCVTFPTRENSVLDQFFSNFKKDYLTPSQLPPIGRSDHCTILWCPILKSSNFKKVKVRHFSKSACAAFYETVNNVNWVDFFRDDMSLESIVCDFQDCVKYLFDLYFRVKTVRIRDHEPPWMNHNLKILINDCDRAFSTNNRAKFCRLRNEVISLIQYLKGEFLKKAVASGNVKKVWNAIGTLSKRHKKSEHCRIPVNDLNDYFASHVQADIEPLVFDDFVLTGLSNYSLSFSCGEVTKCLSKMTKASCGPDGIPPWILRNCRNDFAPLLTLIFNRSLFEGNVPRCLKSANVTPVAKNSQAKDVRDFRPISILPALSKVFEKLFCCKYVVPYICDKVEHNQFAYVPGPGKGTTVALTCIYHHILRFLDTESGCVRVAAVDLSKAFDSLTHRSVIDACIHFKLPKASVKWIMSYLSNRCQRVFLNGVTSPFVSVDRGVPQGSVIGPILFSMVIDSLVPVCKNSHFFKYADDLTVLHFIRNNAEDQLQIEMEQIEA